MLVDSGSSINVIDEPTFDKIKQKVALRRADTHVFAYGSSKTLQIVGKFEATIENKRLMSLTYMSSMEITVRY